MIAQNQVTRKTEQITKEQFETTLYMMGRPGYVPPVSPFKLGRLALRRGITPQPSWPELMVNGWNFEGARCEGLSMLEVM